MQLHRHFAIWLTQFEICTWTDLKRLCPASSRLKVNKEPDAGQVDRAEALLENFPNARQITVRALARWGQLRSLMISPSVGENAHRAPSYFSSLDRNEQTN